MRRDDEKKDDRRLVWVNGEAITRLRKQQGLTQIELAEKAGVGEDTIKRAEANFRYRMKVKNLKAVAGALGVKLSDIMSDTDPARALESGMHRIPLCLFHRITPGVRDTYYAGALSSGKPVLYLSIMSKNSFAMVENYLTSDTQLTVLTWNPATVEEIVGLSKHLNEGDNKIEQTQNALEGWDKLAEQSNVAVYTYSSTPTLQGVLVENQWALIEIIPYATLPEVRPALLLRRDNPAEKQVFDFFFQSFKRLLASASRRRPGEKSSWYHKDDAKGSTRKRRSAGG